MRGRSERPGRRRGATMVLTALMMTVILGFVDSVAGADFALEVTGMGAAQAGNFIL